MRFMQLVEGKLRRRKVPRTEAALARQAMWCPVSAQAYEEVAREGEAVDVVTLRPLGMPMVRDLLDLGDWRVMRAALRLWAHHPGPIAGTLCASSAEVASHRDWDLCAAAAPAVVVL